jgi:small subunit ribosomal protein S6
VVRPYEALYIVDPETSDEDMTTITEKYRNVVVEQGGEVEEINRWDRRRLAYEVMGRTEGIYVLMTFKAESGVETELGRVMRISDDVLRHLITRRDED